MTLKYIFTSILIMLAGCLSAIGATHDVCPDCEINTMAEGINIAKPHDTLNIGKGVYLENDLLVNKPMTILGASGAIIDGQSKGTIMTISADTVVMMGMTVRNVGVSYTKDYAAVKLVRCRNFV